MNIGILAMQFQEVVCHLPPADVEQIEKGKPLAHASMIVKDAQSMHARLTKSDLGAKLAFRALQAARGPLK